METNSIYDQMKKLYQGFLLEGNSYAVAYEKLNEKVDNRVISCTVVGGVTAIRGRYIRRLVPKFGKLNHKRFNSEMKKMASQNRHTPFMAHNLLK